nr:hypothetical protein [Tanacetum cinerariifolium]
SPCTTTPSATSPLPRITFHKSTATATTTAATTTAFLAAAAAVAGCGWQIGHHRRAAGQPPLPATISGRRRRKVFPANPKKYFPSPDLSNPPPTDAMHRRHFSDDLRSPTANTTTPAAILTTTSPPWQQP